MDLTSCRGRMQIRIRSVWKPSRRCNIEFWSMTLGLRRFSPTCYCPSFTHQSDPLLPLLISNNVHLTFNQPVSPRILYNRAKVTNRRPKSHHCPSLQFHLPLHHTTSTNTQCLSIHALLHLSMQSDDASHYCLPFVNLEVTLAMWGRGS